MTRPVDWRSDEDFKADFRAWHATYAPDKQSPLTPEQSEVSAVGRTSLMRKASSSSDSLRSLESRVSIQSSRSSTQSVRTQDSSKSVSTIKRIWSLVFGPPKEKISKQPPEAPKTLEDYLEITGDIGKKKEISDLIKLGKEVIHFFEVGLERADLHTALNLEKNTANDEKIVAALVWALMDGAIQRGQGFTNGAFMLEDPKGLIQHFLQSRQESYKRISSHLNRLEKTSWGLDLPPSEENRLPAGFKHLLFKPIKMGDKTFIFLKPEPYGLKGAEAILGHGYHYIQSVGRKKLPSIFGSDQGVGKRKERVPKSLLNEFKALLDTSIYPPHQKRQYYKEAKTYGIGAMYKKTEFYFSNDSRLQEKQSAFRIKLENIYGKDHIETRIGEEVIFTQGQIEPPPL